MEALARKPLPEQENARWRYQAGREGLIRAFDLVASVVLLILLAPLLLMVALAIKLDSPGPIFFRQERVGRGGRPFLLWKFRTMIPSAASEGMGLLTTPDDYRITRVGRLLRLASIDELPQLLNVIKGDMSLVGPRPGLPEHLAAYDSRQRRRLLVRPGITGLAQVKGRNSLPWPERIEYDLQYVENRSLLLNLRILLATVPVLFRRDLVYGPPENFLFGEREAR